MALVMTPCFLFRGEQCASAELAPGVKNLLSHRAQAMNMLAERLKVHC